MKQLRLLGAACVLALMLTATASAGHIETGVISPEPSPSPSQEVTVEEVGDSSIAGHIHTGVETTDATTQATLNIISVVLALF